MAPALAVPPAIPKSQYLYIARTPLNVLIVILCVLSLLIVITGGAWYLFKFVRQWHNIRKNVRTLYIYPARWCGGARRKDKQFKLNVKRRQNEKRRPPPLNFGAVNFAQEHLPFILNTPTSSISSPSLSPHLSGIQHHRLSSSSSSPASLSPRLPRDIIREKSSPSRLGFIQVEHFIEGPRRTSIVTSWCESPVDEKFFPVMPEECRDRNTYPQHEKRSEDNTALGMSREEQGQGQIEEYYEVDQLNASDSDDSWDFKCRGDVEGDDSEYNVDGSYKLPIEDVLDAGPASHGIEEPQHDIPSVPAILVYSPTFPPSPLMPIAEGSCKSISSYLSVPKRNGKGRGAEVEVDDGQVPVEISTSMAYDDTSTEETEDDYSSLFEYDYILEAIPNQATQHCGSKSDSNARKAMLSASVDMPVFTHIPSQESDVASASLPLAQPSTLAGSQLNSFPETVVAASDTDTVAAFGSHSPSSSGSGSGSGSGKFVEKTWSSTGASLTSSRHSLKGKAIASQDSLASCVCADSEANATDASSTIADGVSGTSPTDSCKPPRSISAPFFIFSTATTPETDNDQNTHLTPWDRDVEVGLTAADPSPMEAPLASTKKRFSFPGLGNMRKNKSAKAHTRANEVDLEANTMAYKNSDWDALLDQHDSLAGSRNGSSPAATSRVLSSARGVLGSLSNIPAKLTRSMSDKVKARRGVRKSGMGSVVDLENGVVS